jgi:protein SCO1/2
MYSTFKIRDISPNNTHISMGRVVEDVRSQLGQGKRLVPYLRQQHSEYLGKSTNEIKRQRAFLFEAFAQTGLPEKALPYVLEVLETEHHAYLVASAAMALRGMKEPRPQIAPYLIQAIDNMKFSDNFVSFGTGGEQFQTTAMAEICRTLQWMGGAAFQVLEVLKSAANDTYLSDKVKIELQKAVQSIESDPAKYDNNCCKQPFYAEKTYSYQRIKSTKRPDNILLQDHHGEDVAFESFFVGKPSVVVFFYSRCDNPTKCSLTISRLHELQQEIQAAGIDSNVRVAAITYDSSHDDPPRLKAYAEARKMELNSENRVFRVRSDMSDLLAHFDAGVNFMGPIVNHHTTEIFILDHNGDLVGGYRQLRWNTALVVADLKKLVKKQERYGKSMTHKFLNRVRAITAPILSFIIVFFPKCPLCLAAYMSVFGISNIHFLRFAVKLLPLFIILLCINLYVLYKGARRRNGLLPFYLSVSGLGCIIVFSQLLGSQSAGYLGIGLMLTGALLNSLPRENFMKLRLAFSELLHTDFRQTNR